MALKIFNSFGDEVLLRSVDWLENLPWNQDNTLKTQDRYEVHLNLKDFGPEDITVKVVNGFLVIEANHEERKDKHGYISRKIVRRYLLPQNCDQDEVKSMFSSDGVLTVIAPMKSMPKADTVIPVKNENSTKCKL